MPIAAIDPGRGDLVSFGETRGARIVKDVRLEKGGAATSVVGILIDIDRDNDSAPLFVSSENDTRYEIKLTEVVSRDKSLLKDKEQVDGILHMRGRYLEVRLPTCAHDGVMSQLFSLTWNDNRYCTCEGYLSLASSFLQRFSGGISSGLKKRAS